MTNNKIREKSKALKYLLRIEEIRHEQRELWKAHQNEIEGVNFLKKIKLHQTYMRQRDKLDFEADELTDKYTMLLRKVKKFSKNDYLRYKDGLLDRRFVEFIFKDVS